MFDLISRLRSDERGATATEYAMLIVFVALAIAVGAQALGNDLNDLFQRVGATLTGVTGPHSIAPPAMAVGNGLAISDLPFQRDPG